jgi:DNA integrity scanning protein DisA with diadenylate cyclase activity
MTESAPARLRRLGEELEEVGLRVDPSAVGRILLEEIDLALRPPVHERRVVSGGTIVEPAADPSLWAPGTDLAITRGELGDQPLRAARRFADGLSSWLLRRANGQNEWVIFDRPAGSERDLVVMARVLQATIVQRHPAGTVRVVGPSGVFRWKGISWHHEPRVTEWLTALSSDAEAGDAAVLTAILAFAVHDLGSLGIGALLVYRSHSEPGPPVEQRLPEPPPLQVQRASHLAPLRHALAQIDGAAIFDRDGVLRQLGVRLMTSKASERNVEGLGGTRHTSGRRYSYDDPFATVVAVSDDGPVTVFRGGSVLGTSHDGGEPKGGADHGDRNHGGHSPGRAGRP